MRLLLLFFSWFLLNTGFSQVKLPVQLKSGDYYPLTVGEWLAAKNLSPERFVILQFENNQDIDQFYKQTGIRLYDYLPQNSYYAVLPDNFDFLKVPPEISGIMTISPQMKIDPAEWVNRQVGQIKVSYFEEAGVETLINDLKERGFEVLYNSKIFKTLYLKSKEDIAGVLSIAGIYWAEPRHGPLEAFNLVERTNHRASAIGDNNRPGKGLTGAGINIGEWDGGDVGSHEDFNSRLTVVKKLVGVSAHATHVCGTMAGAGNIDPLAKGMAPAAEIFSWDFYGDIPIEMDTNCNKYGYTLTQNSYAYSPSDDPCSLRGNYDQISREMDLTVEKYPNLLHVFAAGNSRANNCKANGFRTVMSGFQSAKNVMTVAAVSNLDGDAWFSSCGPTRDGRLKPEVSAVGMDVYSTLQNNTYQGGWNGTSMACPGASGTTALVYEHYKRKHGVLPEAHIAKNLMANSADDMGNNGPDFRYGFGRINGKTAVQIIDSNWYKTDSVKNNFNDFDTLKIPKGLFKIKVMLCWNDKAGAAGARPSLINDLDLTVTDSAGTVYKSWVLDTVNCNNPALRGRDSLNNIEQVTIDNPKSGNLIISVKGKRVTTSHQGYSLTWALIKTGIEVIYPNGLERIAPPSSSLNAQIIRWDANNINGNVKLEYSIDHGVSWQTINSSVPASQKYFVWNNSPDTVNTSKALIKISSGIYSDQSDTVFCIFKSPTGLISIICDSQVHFRWPAQKSVISYNLFQLINGQMNAIYTGYDTFFTVKKLSNGKAYWFALSSISDKGAESNRTYAVCITPTSGVKPPKITLNIGDTAGCKNSTLALKTAVSGTGTIFNLWQRSTDKGITWYTLGGRISDTLLLQNLQFSQNDWRYRKVFYNACEGKVYTFPARVEVDTLVPSFSIPSDTLGCTGGDITLSIHNLKSVSKPVVHWMSICNTGGSTGTRKKSLEPYLELTDLNLVDAKNYPVSAANSCGSYCARIGCCGITLKVAPKLSLDLKDNDTICMGQSYNIQPKITDGNSFLYRYKWNGPDTSANTKNLKIKPSKTSRYFFEVHDQNCTPGSIIDSIDIIVRDSLKLQTSKDTIICYGNPVTINANASGGNKKYVFEWNSGLTNGNNHLVSPLKTVAYIVKLTDNCSSDILRDTILIKVYPPLSQSVKVKNDTICIGQNTVLTAIPTGGKGKDYIITWSTNELDSSITVNPVVSRFYTAKISDGCTKPVILDSVKVNVRQALTLKLSAPDTVCYNIPFSVNSKSAGGYFNGHNISWERFTGSGQIKTDSTKTGIWEKAILNDNCTSIQAIDSIWVNVWEQPKIKADPDTTLCYGQDHSLSLTGIGGKNGTIETWWELNKAIFSQDIINIDPMIEGTFNYIAVIRDGCKFSYSDTTTIQVLQKLEINPKFIRKCALKDSLIVFKISGGKKPMIELIWSDGLKGFSRTFKESLTKIYTVTIDDKCSDTSVYNIPVVIGEFGTNDFSFKSIIDKSVTIQASIPLQNVEWNFGDGFSNYFTDTIFERSYADYGHYTICRKQTDNIGCINEFCRDLEIIDVMKNKGFNMIISPNPNQGKFELTFNKIPGNLQVEIYNELGQILLSESSSNYTGIRFPFDIGRVSPGLYFLKVTMNGEIATRKIVIKL